MAEVSTLLMKIKDIKGTSNIEGHLGWIVLQNINTSLHANVEMNGKGSLAVGGAMADGVHISKSKDGTDLKMRAALLDATVFDKVEIVKIIDNNAGRIISEKIELINFAFSYSTISINDSGDAEVCYTGVFSAIKLEGNEVDASGKVTKFGPIGYDFAKAKKM